MYINNYGNYINYTKWGLACENRFPAASGTQTETQTSRMSNCPTECYYHLYTFSFTTSQQ